MSERKVQQKYYPPDYDYRRKAPRTKAKKTKKGPGQWNIRNMLPFTVRCLTCNEFMYTGTKFNTPMERAGDYLGVPIYRFYYRCPQCSAQFTMCTDPENESYVVEQGATRPFGPSAGFKTQRAVAHEAAAAMEEAQAVKDSGDNRSSGTGLGGANAMEAVEARAEGMRQQMESEEAVEALLERQRLAHSLGPDELLDMLHKGDLGAALPESTAASASAAAAASSSSASREGDVTAGTAAAAAVDDEEASRVFAERRLRDSAVRLGIADPERTLRGAMKPPTSSMMLTSATAQTESVPGASGLSLQRGSRLTASGLAGPASSFDQVSSSSSAVGKFFAVSASRKRRRPVPSSLPVSASVSAAMSAEGQLSSSGDTDKAPFAKQAKPQEPVATPQEAMMIAYASSSSSDGDDDDGDGGDGDDGSGEAAQAADGNEDADDKTTKLVNDDASVTATR